MELPRSSNQPYEFAGGSLEDLYRFSGSPSYPINPSHVPTMNEMTGDLPHDVLRAIDEAYDNACDVQFPVPRNSSGQGNQAADLKTENQKPATNNLLQMQSRNQVIVEVPQNAINLFEALEKIGDVDYKILDNSAGQGNRGAGPEFSGEQAAPVGWQQSANQVPTVMKRNQEPTDILFEAMSQTQLPAYVNIGAPKVRFEPQQVALILGHIASPMQVPPTSSMRFNVYEVLRTGQKILQLEEGPSSEAILREILRRIDAAERTYDDCIQKAMKPQSNNRKGRRNYTPRIAYSIGENGILHMELGTTAWQEALNSAPKPPKNFDVAIYLAFKRVKCQDLTNKDIYGIIKDIFPYYQESKKETFMSSIRNRLTTLSAKEGEESARRRPCLYRRSRLSRDGMILWNIADEPALKRKLLNLSSKNLLKMSQAISRNADVREIFEKDDDLQQLVPVLFL